MVCTHLATSHPKPTDQPKPATHGTKTANSTPTDNTPATLTTSDAHPGAARASGEVSTHWRTSGGIAPVDPPTVNHSHGTTTPTTTTTALQAKAAAVDKAEYRDDSEDET